MQVSIPIGFSVDWIGDALYFGSGSSIWTIGFKDGSPQPATLRKLASGTTDMVNVRGTTSKLVFASSTTAFHLWSLPIELNSGKVLGPMQPLASYRWESDYAGVLFRRRSTRISAERAELTRTASARHELWYRACAEH